MLNVIGSLPQISSKGQCRTSTKVAHIGKTQIYLSIAFSENTRSIRFKLHMKTPYDKLAKIYRKCNGHITKTSATLIYNITFKMFFSRARRPMTLGFGMSHFIYAPYQDCTNDDPRLTLTYLR